MFPLKEIEAAVLQEIEKTAMSQTIFNLWFRDLRVEEMTADCIFFSTDAPFKKNILTEKFGDVLLAAIKAACGYPFSFSVTVRGDSASGEAPVSFSDSATDAPVAPEKKKVDIGEAIESPAIVRDFTFENFVVGDSNRFAYTACEAVALQRSDDSFNPLFIYGPSGLGKTHLLYAITNRMKERNPNIRIVYRKSEDFTNDLIASIQAGSTQKFRDKYRSADVLLIDDVQFIAGKVQTQEEFFHTFGALYDAGKQIILTSDRPPKEIRTLEERLRTRFEWGLLADIQPPSLELRIAILKNKADHLGLRISEKNILYMAENLSNNVRQLEGAIKKISAYSILSGGEISDENVHAIVADLAIGTVSQEEIVKRIFSLVAQKYGVTVEEIKGKRRTAGIVMARHVAVWMIRTNTDYSFNKIGAIFSRDHATAMASWANIEEKILKDKDLENMLNDLSRQVQK